jgi:hypothetical protein
MEPGEWARKALDIIESETRDLVHSGRQRASPKLTWRLRHLFRKSQPPRLQKSKK